MYPYLAQGVADLFIPAPVVADASIPDTDTKTTAAVTGLLRSLGEGKVDPESFAPAARPQMVGAIEQFALPFFRALGPPQSLSLLADTTEDDRHTRRYRVWYGGKKPVQWKFDLDRDGKILMMEPTPE
jgi:hypothetical protein